jgi:ectoine hydroxylase-related dioxygenase (phytanoyl-CoA dioxygenase family)
MAMAAERDFRQRFIEDGFFVARQVLDDARDIQPLVKEYTTLLDKLMASWHAAGKLQSAFHDLPLGQKVIEVVKAGLPYYQHLNIALPISASMRMAPDAPIHVGPAVFNLLTSPRLLSVVEQIIGSEIFSSPVQNIRIKAPERMVPQAIRSGSTAAVDWHQDQSAYLQEADQTDVLTVWLPVTDATEENGCLLVVPGSHRDGLVTHCPPDERKMLVHLPEKLVPLNKAVSVPMKRGDVLFMHRCMMHASLENTSDDIRWSFDLRYCPTGQPTGRPIFPGFVARSRQHPETELRDAKAWADLWFQTRARLSQAEPNGSIYSRWPADAAVCA